MDGYRKGGERRLALMLDSFSRSSWGLRWAEPRYSAMAKLARTCSAAGFWTLQSRCRTARTRGWGARKGR